MHLSKQIRRLALAVGSLAICSLSAVAQPLNGNYTVGGTTPNYATLTAAVNDLNAKGVSGPVTFRIRNGAYTGATWAASVNNITGASATNRITITSETNNAANVSIAFTGTAATNYVLRLNGASFVTIKHLTFRNIGTTNGRVLHMVGATSSDSAYNCVFEAPVRTATAVATAVLFADVITGNNNVFVNNTLRNGSYGIYYTGPSETALIDGAVFANNIITNVYQYSTWFYYTKNLKFNNNTISTNSTNVTSYGVYAYYCDDAFEVRSNKISGLLSGYGINTYYCDGTAANRGFIANNTVTMGTNASLTRGINSFFCSYQRFYNNSVNLTGTSATLCIAAYFHYDNTLYQNNEICNNIFAASGAGRALYIQEPGYNNTFDYNNLYVTGAVLVQQGIPVATYANLTAWRAAAKRDMNSVSMNPGFTSATDLIPNPANATSWSLNGRGTQLATNTADINGAARAGTRAVGVPDIGAYEFTPTVAPPNALATPAAPALGITQVFSVGLDTVATITWDGTTPIPPSITIRQYTGTMPVGINAISTTNPFYYIDIIVPAGVYNYASNVYYKEPWLGTIGAESGLRLAQKDATNPWTAFAPLVSKPDVTRNFINTTGLTTFGLFTGVDLPDNAGAAEVTDPVQFVCSGTFPVKVKVKNTGSNVLNNVQVGWSIDGVAQTPVNYTTAIPVSGEASVTLGNIVLSNIPKDVKVWTSMPNGQPDLVAEDDTTVRKLSGGLSGVYTVGGTTPHFASVTDAAFYLRDFGVCGPVVFNIRDGNYAGQQADIGGAIDGISAVNRVTFQSESQNASAVTVSFDGTTTVNNFVFQLTNASNFTIKGLTLVNNNATLGRVIEMNGAASSDSIINCRFLGATGTTVSDLLSLVYANNVTGSNNVFIGNKIENSCYGITYRGTGETVLADKVLFYNNEFINQYRYGAYFLYTKDLKFHKNVIRTNSTSNPFYGIYSEYADEAVEITGNKVTGAIGGYGLYVHFSDGTAAKRGLIANNIVSIGTAANTTHGIRCYNSSYMRIYNNSVNIASTSATNSIAGYFYSDAATFENNEIYNNALSNSGGGYAMYVHNTTYKNKIDFNNLYTTGPKVVNRGTPALDFATLSAWRIASGLDMNSISHNPGYISTSDLHPDINNPASWSLNGRGIHTAGNTLDYDGAVRVTALADGVPDIGAFEFLPGTLPPVAIATPATPVAGTTQVYTFGGDTVAVISWKPNTLVPAQLNIRQYTGTKPQSFPVPGFMYFYTDMNMPNVTHQFDATIYYKDPWLGTITAENQLRFAQKLAINPWVAYNDGTSVVNTGLNFLKANDMTSFGAFTGITDGALFSAVIAATGPTVFCTGGSVTLNANTGTNYVYQWKWNGVAIPGAVNATYTATIAGDYTVAVTNASNITAESLPVGVTIISLPAAVITASGPLSYCIGGSLTLNANTGLGLTYQWHLNGNNIPGATTPSVPVTAAGPYTVTVKNIACGTSSLPTVIAPGPLTVSLGLDTSYCENSKILLLDAGHPGATYTWSNGATTQQISLANQSGKYWVAVDAGPNCNASDTIVVNVSPLPSIVGISYLQTGSDTYIFSPSGVMNTKSFLWIFSDGGKDTSKNVTYTFLGSDFDVTLVAYNDCGTDTTYLKLPSSVNDIKNVLTSGLYPNPANDNITINVSESAGINNIVIVNNVGAIAYKQQVNAKGLHILNVDISGFAQGHYMARLETTLGIITIPFSVLR